MTTEIDQQAPSLEEDIAASLVMDEPEQIEPEIEAGPEAPEDEESALDVAEAIEALEPPTKWDKRYKEAFSSWGEMGEDGQPLYANGRDWQQRILDMYNEGQGYATRIEQERKQYMTERDQLNQFAQQWNGVISPYQEDIATSGTTPDQYVRQGLGLLKALRNNPQATLTKLARESGIDLNAALEGQEWESPESKQIKSLQREMENMRRNALQTQQQAIQRQQQAIQQQNAQQIQAFVDATDESGSPKYPHVDALQDTMAQLIYGRENLRRANPSLPPMGLEEAYQQACKLSDQVTQEEAEKAESARLAKASAEAKKATEAARRVKPGSAGKQKPERSLRDDIRANIQTAA